jgi:pimeloyl-ACP methyl ester carboxylesterase
MCELYGRAAQYARAVPLADVNGVRLFHDERGEGEPLLCVMGLASDHRAWALQMDAFSERHRVIVFDNRDIGESTICEDDYEIADLADDTVALADHLGLERFHLLGISLGSCVAQHVALRIPERVHTLTLAATWAGTATAFSEMRARVWEREVRRSSREEFLEEFMLLTLSEQLFETEEAVETVKRMTLENPNPQPIEALIRQIRATARHDIRDRLPELRMPVHVIAGDRDLLIPPWKSEEVAEYVDGASLTMLRGIGHSMNLERVDEFNRAVLAWLDEHPLPPAD